MKDDTRTLPVVTRAPVGAAGSTMPRSSKAFLITPRRGWGEGGRSERSLGLGIPKQETGRWRKTEVELALFRRLALLL